MDQQITKLVAVAFRLNAEDKALLERCINLASYPYQIYDLISTRIQQLITTNTYVLAFGEVAFRMALQASKDATPQVSNLVIRELPPVSQLRPTPENKEFRVHAAQIVTMLGKQLNEPKINTEQLVTNVPTYKDLSTWYKTHRPSQSIYLDGLPIEITADGRDNTTPIEEVLIIRHLMDVFGTDTVKIKNG